MHGVVPFLVGVLLSISQFVLWHWLEPFGNWAYAPIVAGILLILYGMTHMGRNPSYAPGL